MARRRVKPHQLPAQEAASLATLAAYDCLPPNNVLVAELLDATQTVLKSHLGENGVSTVTYERLGAALRCTASLIEVQLLFAKEEKNGDENPKRSDTPEA